MTSLTTHDCALNAAEAISEAKSAADPAGLAMVADQWIRLLDAMTRAGIGRAERGTAKS